MTKPKQKPKANKTFQPNGFHIEFWNTSQELAWSLYQRHEVMFLIGPAGTAKTHLAMAFALHDVLNHKQTGKKHVLLSRPVVQAGEDLGYLPGEMENKVGPYMDPLIDCLDRMLPKGSPQREMIAGSVEFRPLAFQRGRTFYNSVVILDEAQNATREQMKMFITRKGKDNCKLIITGDPDQSDLPPHARGALAEMAEDLETCPGTAIVRFNEEAIVRDDWVKEALKRIRSRG